MMAMTTRSSIKVNPRRGVGLEVEGVFMRGWVEKLC